MQRPVSKKNYNGVDQHAVLSPRSTDGVGMSVAEFVLASSPGGPPDMGSQISKMKASLVSKRLTGLKELVSCTLN